MSSFTSRLKAIGLAALKGLEFAGKEIIQIENIEPFVKLLLPQTPKVIAVENTLDVSLTKIQSIIHEVEIDSVLAGGMTGVQKLQLAVGRVLPLLNASGIMNPKALADTANIQTLVENLINALVAIENAHKAI